MELLRPKDACRLLGISHTTLLAWEKAGKITSDRTIGNHRRYRSEDLESLKPQTNPALVWLRPVPISSEALKDPTAAPLIADMVAEQVKQAVLYKARSMQQCC